MKRRPQIRSRFGLAVLLLASFTVFFGWTSQSRPGDRSEDEVSIRPAKSLFAAAQRDLVELNARVEQGIASGGLKLLANQVEDLGTYNHERYEVRYQGIRIWGAQVLRHFKNGRLYLINGSTYDDVQSAASPSLQKTDAILAAKAGSYADFEVKGEPELVIFPAEGGYRLAYLVSLLRRDSLMRCFVDALTGELFHAYDDMRKEAAVGSGKGVHGDTKKMSTDHKNNVYYAIDLLRPAKLITGNMWHGENTDSIYYITDADNSWTEDACVADAHAYLGWIYDYYYLVHGRKGMDDANQENVVAVHFGTNYENAFYSPASECLYFGDGNPAAQYPYTAALDIIAHEFTHGVTAHSSGLIYQLESGALNEAFSDIMGVSCEFFHQPEGNGYNKAEWWQGEDINKPFGPGRDLSDPSSQNIPGYIDRYPDHYSKRYKLPLWFDQGGVHINMTIPTHWYYLLAHGGTNKTSRQTVTGIGLEKAEKIAYRCWVYYLHPSATFASARSASYQAAVDLFGATSIEALRVAQAWNAVGVY